MRLILLLVGGLLLANIVTATFFARPESGARAPVENSATLQGKEPWLASEAYLVSGRDNIRRGVRETLDRAWSSYCTPDGHKDLLNAVSNYYYQRHAELWSKVNTYGEAARPFAIKVWSTTDDSRIERLIVETYGRGYFSLDELQLYAREALTPQVKGTAVRVRPCAG